MKTFILIGNLFLASVIFAAVPEPIITYKDSYNGHATIAGRLASKNEGPVGISVQNGNLKYSTLTDSEGRWGIVIRHTAISLQVYSWDLKNPDERSTDLMLNMGKR